MGFPKIAHGSCDRHRLPAETIELGEELAHGERSSLRDEHDAEDPGNGREQHQAPLNSIRIDPLQVGRQSAHSYLKEA